MLTPCTRANSYAKHAGCFWWVGLFILVSSLHNKSRKPVRNAGFIIGRQQIDLLGSVRFLPSIVTIHPGLKRLLIRYLPLFLGLSTFDMYSKSSSSVEKSKHPTALDRGMLPTMFAERFAVSLPFRQKSVSTSIDSNGYPSGPFNKSIRRRRRWRCYIQAFVNCNKSVIT